MNKFDAKALATAIGPRNGDFLELSNTWARVLITTNVAAGQPTVYVVTGDLADVPLRDKEFPTLESAVAYAWRSLGVFQKGRVTS